MTHNIVVIYFSIKKNRKNCMKEQKKKSKMQRIEIFTYWKRIKLLQNIVLFNNSIIYVVKKMLFV